MCIRNGKDVEVQSNGKGVNNGNTPSMLGRSSESESFCQQFCITVQRLSKTPMAVASSTGEGLEDRLP